MKTLDEVIDKYEKCNYVQSCCNDCSYCNEECCCDRDALHYLKMYRSDRLQWEADRKQWKDIQEQVDEARQKFIDRLKELEIGTLNDPLTWDELKAMKGKPVWVEWTVKDKWHHGDWNLVHAQLDDRIWFVDGNRDITNVPKGLQGISWQAYRKEQN